MRQSSRAQATAVASAACPFGPALGSYMMLTAPSLVGDLATTSTTAVTINSSSSSQATEATRPVLAGSSIALQRWARPAGINFGSGLSERVGSGSTQPPTLVIDS